MKKEKRSKIHCPLHEQKILHNSCIISPFDDDKALFSQYITLYRGIGTLDQNTIIDRDFQITDKNINTASHNVPVQVYYPKKTQEKPMVISPVVISPGDNICYKPLPKTTVSVHKTRPGETDLLEEILQKRLPSYQIRPNKKNKFKSSIFDIGLANDVDINDNSEVFFNHGLFTDVDEIWKNKNSQKQIYPTYTPYPTQQPTPQPAIPDEKTFMTPILVNDGTSNNDKKRLLNMMEKLVDMMEKLSYKL